MQLFQQHTVQQQQTFICLSASSRAYVLVITDSDQHGMPMHSTLSSADVCIRNNKKSTLFCYLGMVTVMDGPETGPFNIGNPTEFTMLELAEMVQKVVNPKVKIVYKENTADDPSKRKPDISKVSSSAATLQNASACCMRFSGIRHNA